MNTERRDEFLREVFRRAANADSDNPKAADAEDTHHVVDDDELLVNWSLGDVTDEQRAQIIAHLADCPACRQELAAMIHAGALVLPDAEEVPAAGAEIVPVAQTASERTGFAARGRRFSGVMTVLAACLLIAVVWVLSDQGSESALAMARRDLDAGNAAGAFERVSQYMSEQEARLPERDLQEAKTLLEESGYRVAQSGVQGGDPGRVEEIVQVANRRGARSGRLANLLIQVRRRLQVEDALAAKGTLVDYGFELDGQAYEKEFSGMDADAQQIDRDYAAAVAAHPDTLQLRLNYGQFLLEVAPSRAAEQFLVAVKLDPSNALAHTGIGLALFRQNRDDAAEQALVHFEKAALMSPDDASANLNLAVCLNRLGRREPARRYLRTAWRLCTRPALRDKIKTALDGP